MPVRDPRSAMLLCRTDATNTLRKLLRLTIEVEVDGVSLCSAAIDDPAASSEKLLPQLGFLRCFEHVYVSHELYQAPITDVPGRLLFGYLARIYESLIIEKTNVEIYNRLLSEVLRTSRQDRPRVLDFGCGTGLVMKSQWVSRVDITGFDFCEEVGRIARERGLTILSTDSFWTSPRMSFDFAIASFVLHFPVSPRTLCRLWELIQPGGSLVANFHKRINEEWVTDAILGFGGRIETAVEGSNSRFGFCVFRREA